MSNQDFNIQELLAFLQANNLSMDEFIKLASMNQNNNQQPMGLNPMMQMMGNQGLTPNSEEALINMMLNPVRLKRTTTNLMDSENNPIILEETKEGTIIENGVLQDISQSNFHMLDDGTSTSPLGITICQTCGGKVKQDNIRRCGCGKTCCVICAKGSEFMGFFCSTKHKILGGTLGFSLR